MPVKVRENPGSIPSVEFLEDNHSVIRLPLRVFLESHCLRLGFLDFPAILKFTENTEEDQIAKSLLERFRVGLQTWRAENPAESVRRLKFPEWILGRREAVSVLKSLKILRSFRFQHFHVSEGLKNQFDTV